MKSNLCLGGYVCCGLEEVRERAFSCDELLLQTFSDTVTLTPPRVDYRPAGSITEDDSYRVRVGADDGMTFDTIAVPHEYIEGTAILGEGDVFVSMPDLRQICIWYGPYEVFRVRAHSILTEAYESTIEVGYRDTLTQAIFVRDETTGEQSTLAFHKAASGRLWRGAVARGLGDVTNNVELTERTKARLWARYPISVTEKR